MYLSMYVILCLHGTWIRYASRSWLLRACAGDLGMVARTEMDAVWHRVRWLIAWSMRVTWVSNPKVGRKLVVVPS